MIRRGSSAFALLAFAGLAACSEADRRAETSPPAVEVSIGAAMPTPDEEDAYNGPQHRYWSVRPEVTLRLRQDCRGVRLTTQVAGFTDRTGEQRAWADNVAPDLSPEGPRRAGSVYGSTGEAYSAWGSTIRYRAEASCDRGSGRVLRSAQTRWFELPSKPCSEARFRVFDVARAERRGGAGWEAISHDDALATGDEVRVGRGGFVLAGTPECNAFSTSMTSGSYRVGSYAPGSRGVQFYGERIVAAGDSHAGGFTVNGKLDVHPLDLTCDECVPQPSSYEVRSQGRFRATVRVSRGAVLASSGGDRLIRVRSGHQADAVCTPHCRLTSRLFQPREPWSTPPDSSGRFVTRLTSPPGRTPPAARLAPPHAEARVENLAGDPAQIFVAWQRELRTRGGAGVESFTRQSGVLIWERARVDEWRVVYSRRFPGSEPPVDAQLQDVTRDGRRDVLVSQVFGSGACGPRIVLATVRGTVRTLLRRWTCETEFRLERGLVLIDEPVGPCPYRDHGAHCFGGGRHVVMRWNGRALETISATVRCALPHLDTARDCRPGARRRDRRRAPG